MGIKWKEIPGYSRYMVSEYGHIWGRRSGKILKPSRGGLFYEYIQYYLERDDGVRKQEKAHRLVATCFIGDGSGLEVDHIDNNKINNHYSKRFGRGCRLCSPMRYGRRWLGQKRKR